MRFTFTIVGFFIAVSSFGQNKDTLKLNLPSDTLKVDSIKSRLKIPTTSTNKVDSVKNRLSVPKDSLNQKLHSFGSDLNGKTDSLKLETNNIARKVAGLTDSLKINIQNKLKDESLTEHKLSGNADLPENVNPTVKLPNLKLAIPKDVNVPTELSTPQLNTGIPIAAPQIKSPAIDTTLPEINTEIPIDSSKLKSLAMEKISSIEGIPERDKLYQFKETMIDSGKLKSLAMENLSSIDGAPETDELYQIKNEVEKIKEGGIKNINAEAVENEIMEASGVAEIDELAQKAKALQAQQEALLQQYMDKKLLQAEILRKSANVKNDAFNKGSQTVRQGQQHITKTRKVNSSVQSTKGMVRKRSNDLKDKPFYERLQPGVTVQTYNADIFQVDIGLQLGYRLTNKWTVGVGGIHRFGVSREFDYFIQSQDTYGYRSFLNLKIVKSLYVYGEYEWLKHSLQKLQVSETESSNSSAIALGLSKRFNLSKKINGNILALYKIEASKSSINMNKFGVRLGFNWNTKKTRRTTTSSKKPSP